MPVILGSLLIGLVSKLGGDYIADVAKKLFGGGASAPAPASASRPSFESAFEGARAQQAAPVSPARPEAVGATASAGFAPISTAAELAISPRRTAPPSRDIIAAYMNLDSIQA